ncbi:type II secretion system minor pseudopilin GspK [Achromobacter sp. ACM03]|uniref:Type II secretion system protein K n=4 Tax=Achromobacter aegrifaciens TaxID=1287736 RepID=A0ABU2DGT1_ACHAE|nr:MULTISPECIES: type II secretion system minor pseudopilin GspK [Achromobacter]MBD9379692.1 type II secretion system minor pseudopilin GspK [Achromobacter sp. ACM02]MBD9428469.1 type II secretion system minor pseudopilin GspK [Achromobacter sp. ACM03]MBD9473151.1 type II secretion system minor pseudopilin GspK [Achromobacter sp. ACM01]MDR7947321.1 type II secretion system minor pseudopilin GspK [Achromobacter aegrifaciens]CAB3701126.1 Type II secretion system protein K [Achromobacter aegrifac
MRRPSNAERGAAVISALIIVAIVAALTTGLFQRQTASTRRVENEMARVQARAMLAGGIDWARLIVRDHSKRESITRGDQIWATPVLDTRIERPGDERVAVFSGRVQDEQGKYNLYNLANNGVPQPEQERVLRRLLNTLQLPDTLAARMVDIMSAAQPVAPPADAPAAPPGRPAPDARAPLPRGVDEVAALLALEPSARNELRRTMTVLPVSTSVNVNTAPAEVLAALVPGLSLSQARSMAGERDRGNWFNNSGDFANRLAGAGVKAPAPAVATTSGWFLASGTVAYERARISMQALLRSSPPAAPDTLWTREIP